MRRTRPRWGVDQLETASCEDYEGHRFKPHLNRGPWLRALWVYKKVIVVEDGIWPRVTRARYHLNYPPSFILARRGVDQLATASCKDYGGHRFKPRLNRRPMVAGFVGLQEGYSGSKWDSTPCHVSTIPSQLPFLPFLY